MQYRPDEDLDRTDELPRLDVAAYEASLREREREEDPLSRTDTWVIKALQDDELPDDVDDAPPVRHLRPVAEPAVRMRPIEPTQDVTAEVESILRRIEQLEGELDAARKDSAAWQGRCSELSTERAQQDERATLLTANNARLVEQQQIAYDRTQALEARLREESELAQQRLAELQSALQLERGAHAGFKRDTEHQLREAHTQIDSLSRLRDDLQTQLRSQSELAAKRAAETAAVQTALANQHRAASEMARLLAGKLAEHDAVLLDVERRDAALAALEAVRADLAQQLEAMTLAERQRSDELAQAQARLTQAQRDELELQRTLGERQHEVAQRDEQIRQLRGDLGRAVEERDTARSAHTHEQTRHGELQTTLAAVQKERDALTHTLDTTAAELAARTSALQDANASLEQRATAIRRHEEEAAAQAAAAQGLRSELETALAQVVQLATQRDQLAGERDELSERAASLVTSLAEQQTQTTLAQTENTTLREDLTRVQKLAEERAESLQQMQESFDELRMSGATLEQSLQDATVELQRLQTKVLDQTRDMEAQLLELATSRAEAGRHTREIEDLERAVRLRDELLHTLRQELQTAQDERGIVSIQLDKARGRTKTLAERIFKKDARIAALKAEIAVHSEALATLGRDTKHAGETEIERVLEPLGHEADIVVLKHKVMTVGRTDDNDICVPSKMVSRRHARLLVGPNAVIVEDAGSTNGCYVNDQPVQKHLLREGDVLLIGDRKYKLRTRDKQVATH